MIESFLTELLATLGLEGSVGPADALAAFWVGLWLTRRLAWRPLRARWSGENLPVGPEAQAILDLLAQPGWVMNSDLAVRRGDRYAHCRSDVEVFLESTQRIAEDKYHVWVGGNDIKPFLNRRERSLLKAAARRQRDAVLAERNRHALEEARKALAAIPPVAPRGIDLPEAKRS